MRKHLNSSIQEMKIEALPASGWTADAGGNRVAIMENDVAALLRQVAEYKWAAEEQENKRKDVLIKQFMFLLDMADAFERVFANVEAKKDSCTAQMNAWVGNFRTVYRLLKRSLAEQGVVPIETLDMEFDPRWHEVVEKAHDKARPEGTIVKVIQCGYVWQGQILRKSAVVVVSHERPEKSNYESDTT
jgi:molecular chaperone GrpE